MSNMTDILWKDTILFWSIENKNTSCKQIE